MDHGLSGTRAYSAWAAMHNRCNNPGNQWHHRYGGRGIKVCREWDSVTQFLADMGHPTEGQSIDRIDNDGDYCPANCRWTTREAQNGNTSRNRYLEHEGRTLTIKEWAREYDLAPRRLWERLKRGWDMDRALTTPCPQGYEQGRERACAAAKQLWATKGAEYAARSRAKR